MEQYFNYLEIKPEQSLNMLNQVVPKEEKIELKNQFQGISLWITEVINDARLKPEDEKPTVVWIINQIRTGKLEASLMFSEQEELRDAIVGFYKNQGHLSKLSEYDYPSLQAALEESSVDNIGELVEEGGPFKLYAITTVEDAQACAEGTNWCIKEGHEARQYIQTGSPLYLVMRGSKKAALLHFVAIDFENSISQFLKYNEAAEIGDALPKVRQMATELYNRMKGQIGAILDHSSDITHIQAIEALIGLINTRDPEVIKSMVTMTGQFVRLFEPSLITPEIERLAVQYESSNSFTCKQYPDLVQ